VVGPILLAVWSTYATTDSCDILRAEARVEVSREAGRVIASMLCGGILDGLIAAQYSTLSRAPASLLRLKDHHLRPDRRDLGKCQGSCRLNYVMIPLVDEAAMLAV
jgi:hypothetical protein